MEWLKEEKFRVVNFIKIMRPDNLVRIGPGKLIHDGVLTELDEC